MQSLILHSSTVAGIQVGRERNRHGKTVVKDGITIRIFKSGFHQISGGCHAAASMPCGHCMVLWGAMQEDVSQHLVCASCVPDNLRILELTGLACLPGGEVLIWAARAPAAAGFML